MAYSVSNGGHNLSTGDKKGRSKSMSCSSGSISRLDLNGSIGSISNLETDNDVFVGRKASVPSFRASISISEVPRLSRRGTFKSFAQSITGMMRLRRLTLGKLSVGDIKAKPKVENTYRTEPESSETFSPNKVHNVAKDIIESEMNGVKYNAKLCGTKCCDLASKIKSAIKGLNYRRYRIICQVVIGEVKEQGIEAASRCVWDEKRDNYTYVNYRNDSLFVSAMIYGVYFE